MKKLFLLLVLWAVPFAANAAPPANCLTSSGDTCTRCKSGYWLYSSTECLYCLNASCDGTSTKTCNQEGYSTSGSGTIPTLADGTRAFKCYECTFKTQAECERGYDSTHLAQGWNNQDYRTGSCVKTNGCWAFSGCQSPYSPSSWGSSTGFSGPHCGTCKVSNANKCWNCGPTGNVNKTCVKCYSGYYYKGNNTTEGECATCPSGATCDGVSAPVCNTGYTLSGSTASGYICTKITCNIANCSSCSSTNVCETCAQGYTLVNGACVLKNTISGNCPDFMQKSSDGCCCVYK